MEMEGTGNKILDDARARAHSRSAILQSLQQSFGSAAAQKKAPTQVPIQMPMLDKFAKLAKHDESNSTASKRKTPENNVSAPKRSKGDKSTPYASSNDPALAPTGNPQSYKQVVSESVEAIIKLLGDDSDKTREFYRDGLQSKAVVLENTKSQLSANKTLAKIKKRQKQQQRVSKRQLKAANKSIHHACFDSIYDFDYVTHMHGIWCDYVRSIVRSSKGDNQLQARSQDLELVGAKVRIHQSVKPALVGVEGIVVAQSTNILYLFHSHYDPATPVSQPAHAPPNSYKNKHKINDHFLSTHKLVKVDRREVSLGVLLPDRNKASDLTQRGDVDSPRSDTEDGSSDVENPSLDHVAAVGEVQDSTEGKVEVPATKNWVCLVGRNELYPKVLVITGAHFAPKGSAAT